MFNTHLQSTHVSTSALRAREVRHQQLLELVKFVKRKCHANPGTPYVLVGDFNIDAIGWALCVTQPQPCADVLRTARAWRTCSAIRHHTRRVLHSLHPFDP